MAIDVFGSHINSLRCSGGGGAGVLRGTFQILSDGSPTWTTATNPLKRIGDDYDFERKRLRNVGTAVDEDVVDLKYVRHLLMDERTAWESALEQLHNKLRSLEATTKMTTTMTTPGPDLLHLIEKERQSRADEIKPLHDIVQATPAVLKKMIKEERRVWKDALQLLKNEMLVLEARKPEQGPPGSKGTDGTPASDDYIKGFIEEHQ